MGDRESTTDADWNLDRSYASQTTFALAPSAQMFRRVVEQRDARLTSTLTTVGHDPNSST